TNADPFSAYRPSGTVSGSGSSLGNSFSGTGGGNAFAGGTGTTGNRTNTGTNALGNRNTLGGNLGGNTTALGGNRNAMGGTNLGGNRNAMGMLGGGLLGGTSFLGGGMNNQQNAITMGYSVNFDGMKASTATATAQPTTNVEVQQRLIAAPGMQGASNLQVMMRGETAILRGTVKTDHAKQLAAAMLRLEPGVYEVQNELTVKP
ncbi:MAG TPA: BON domain-containing protein, partial [Gemmatales bacterium]|nr:BON domain-containing protein [Gemmatales bacterium]